MRDLWLVKTSNNRKKNKKKNAKSFRLYESSFVTSKTRAYVEDGGKKCSAGAQKDEKCKYSYDKEKQRLLQEKPV